MSENPDGGTYVVMPLETSDNTEGYRGDLEAAIDHAKKRSIALDMPCGVYLEVDQDYRLVGTAFKGEWTQKVDE